MSKRLELTVSDETWVALDAARGHEPRASFVKRHLERVLRLPEFAAVVADASRVEESVSAGVLEKALGADRHVAQRAVPAPSRASGRSQPAEPYDGPEPKPIVVTDARQAALERQRKLNEARNRK